MFVAGCMFSRAFSRLLILPRVAPVSCFPAHSTVCSFSRVLLGVFSKANKNRGVVGSGGGGGGGGVCNRVIGFPR